MPSKVLKGGLIGCGYFAHNHLEAWQKNVKGAQIVALCDRDINKAKECALKFNISESACYSTIEEMMLNTTLDFLDLVTPPCAHRSSVEEVLLAIKKNPCTAQSLEAIICQKPLCPIMSDAIALLDQCQTAQPRPIPLLVHENFRWQPAMRECKKLMPKIGNPFFCRLKFRSHFDVYTNQPYLATDERFIISDLGVHILDLARFFMGEVKKIYCQTQKVNPYINGEDTATILLTMESGATVIVDICYASCLKDEHFPQVCLELEGTNGSIVVDHDYEITVVTKDTEKKEHFATKFKRIIEKHQAVPGNWGPPSDFGWFDSVAKPIQHSVFLCNQHFSDVIHKARNQESDISKRFSLINQYCETDAGDNIKTLDLVFRCYDSAERNAPVEPSNLSTNRPIKRRKVEENS